MVEQPCLQTERLLLRPFVLADAADVQRLAGEREIAAFTTNIPHPYEDGVAEQWIGTHQEAFEQGRAAHWAIVLRDQGSLIGAIGLSIQREHARAELGYWIGRPYWGRGYCSEAARAVLRYGFTALGLNRIYATHMRSNPASGRVMQKIGMRYEGRLRQHVLKWGVFEDLEVYSILKGEYEAGAFQFTGKREPMSGLYRATSGTPTQQVSVYPRADAKVPRGLKCTHTRPWSWPLGESGV